MTPRERELAKRHHDKLVDMKDEAWRSVVNRKTPNTSTALLRHQALDHAVKLSERHLMDITLGPEAHAAVARKLMAR